MADEDVKAGMKIWQFIQSHWGEIYTGFDVLTNIFGGLSGGGEVPDTVDPKIKGLVGLLGLKDERDFLLKLRATKGRLKPAKFRRLMAYFAWEISQAKELEPRLGKMGAKVVMILYLNRLRTLFAGIPDKAGVSTGKYTETVREPFDVPPGGGRNARRPNGFKYEIRREEDITTDGSKPGVDILVMLADEINGHWLSLSSAGIGEDARLEQAFTLTRDSFRVTGLPMMPRPDEVLNLVALKAWVESNGGLPFTFVWGTLESALGEISKAKKTIMGGLFAQIKAAVDADDLTRRR